MTKSERLKALVRGTPEGTMLFHPIVMHFAARFIGSGYGAFASDYRVLVESNVRCMERFGYDAVSVISDPYRETAAFGAEIYYPEDAVPRCRALRVTSTADLDGLSAHDVTVSPRTRDRIRGVMYYRELLGDAIPVIGWVEGPLAEACDLAGVNETLLNLALDPDNVRRLMDICLPVGEDFARHQIEAGSDIMGVGDAICSQISASMYREFVFPLHCRLFETIHSLGALVKLHICGNIAHILGDLAETGADIIDIDSMVPMEEAFAVVGEKAALSGNLNPVSVIRDMKVGDVYDAAHAMAERFKGRKFILSGGCEIPVDTPHENMDAMMRAAKEVCYRR